MTAGSQMVCVRILNDLPNLQFMKHLCSKSKSKKMGRLASEHADTCRSLLLYHIFTNNFLKIKVSSHISSFSLATVNKICKEAVNCDFS